MGVVPGPDAFSKASQAGANTAPNGPPDLPAPDMARDCAIQGELAACASALLGLDLAEAGPEAIAGLIEAGARRLTASLHALVGWLDPAAGGLALPASARTGWPEDPDPELDPDLNLGALEDHDSGLVVRRPGGAIGRALSRGQPLILDRILAVPVLSAGIPVGVIGLTGADCPYTEADGAAVAPLARLYALALGRMRADAERALLARAVEQAPLGIVITDRAGAIRYVNPAFTEASGFSRDEVLGRNPRLLKSGYTQASEYQRLWETLARGQVWHGEFHNRRKNQTLHWEAAAVAPIRDRRGDVSAFAAFKDDITARKSTEIDLLAAKEAAEDASRAKSTFLAHVSHELRTPLNTIIGFAEIMDRQLFGPVGDSHYRDYARYIGDSGRHLLALINDVLDLSKVGAGQADMAEEAVDLAAAVAATCAQMRGRAEAGRVRMNADWTAPPPPRLRADARMVRQILLNIVSNAVKFTPPEGHVTLLGRRDPDGGVVIEIGDTGPGIGKDVLSVAMTAFGRLATTPGLPSPSSSPPRSGRGLPLAKSLTELHGGSLSVTSAPETGTLVTIRFPAERVLAEDR